MKIKRLKQVPCYILMLRSLLGKVDKYIYKVQYGVTAAL